ncbi:hypothetical protein C8J57DRAFT_1233840 [Mycena rebaudengoi]|nr:hypothetical protein C8J57DRAFT_1233840 [Mycena rebaudengoi]
MPWSFLSASAVVFDDKGAVSVGQTFGMNHLEDEWSSVLRQVRWLLANLYLPNPSKGRSGTTIGGRIWVKRVRCVGSDVSEHVVPRDRQPRYGQGSSHVPVVKPGTTLGVIESESRRPVCPQKHRIFKPAPSPTCASLLGTPDSDGMHQQSLASWHCRCRDKQTEGSILVQSIWTKGKFVTFVIFGPIYGTIGVTKVLTSPNLSNLGNLKDQARIEQLLLLVMQGAGLTQGVGEYFTIEMRFFKAVWAGVKEGGSKNELGTSFPLAMDEYAADAITLPGIRRRAFHSHPSQFPKHHPPRLPAATEARLLYVREQGEGRISRDCPDVTEARTLRHPAHNLARVAKRKMADEAI